MRFFELHRDSDVTGFSGAGVVADGVVFDEPARVSFPDGWHDFPAGWVRLVWRGGHRSVVLWPSMRDVEVVHGHDGATRPVWVEQPDQAADHPGFTSLEFGEPLLPVVPVQVASPYFAGT